MTVYNWLTLFGVPGLFLALIGFIKIQIKQNTAIKEGLQAILRDRLLQGYKHYLEKGWADLDDRANMENVWKQYHALGGNGDMKDLRRTFRHLPMVAGGQPVVVDDES